MITVILTALNELESPFTLAQLQLPAIPPEGTAFTFLEEIRYGARAKISQWRVAAGDPSYLIKMAKEAADDIGMCDLHPNNVVARVIVVPDAEPKTVERSDLAMFETLWRQGRDEAIVSKILPKNSPENSSLDAPWRQEARRRQPR
jgi:hypothetical protein